VLSFFSSDVNVRVNGSLVVRANKLRAFRESRDGQPPLRIGFIAPASSRGALVAQVLARAGCWKLETPGRSDRRPNEPPGWDALLLYASSADQVQRTAERFGLTGPVVVLLKNNGDILSKASALAEADDFIFDTAKPGEFVVRIRRRYKAIVGAIFFALDGYVWTSFAAGCGLRTARSRSRTAKPWSSPA
jgi:hypothetical protein